jgi:hypothetical protein
MRKHLYVMGLTKGSLRRRCGAEEESSAHVLCECENLASLSTHIWAPFLGPRLYNSGGDLELQYGTELQCLGIRSWGTQGLSKGLGASGSKGLEPNYYQYLSPLFLGI